MFILLDEERREARRKMKQTLIQIYPDSAKAMRMKSTVDGRAGGDQEAARLK